MYYIVQSAFCAKIVKYPMGIIWVSYGYPMVKALTTLVIGVENPTKKMTYRLCMSFFDVYFVFIP